MLFNSYGHFENTQSNRWDNLVREKGREEDKDRYKISVSSKSIFD